MAHNPVLHAPWFADPADGTTLHRYLDEQFVQRFLQEAQSGRLQRNADQAWRGEDRFGGRRDHPTLRLPVHRAFYIACCEVSCDAPGLPALDPARILSAGLVVRRGHTPAQAMRWMVQEGVPLGWWGGRLPEHDPSDYRRLRQHDLLPERHPEPAYGGEETAPMHPLHLRVSGPHGASRTRTLLWGYVPLGGQVRVEGPPPAGASGQPDYGKELPWPFGSANGEPSWRQGHGYQVRAGTPEPAFRPLLATLLGRYRVQDAADPANAGLRALLGNIRFHASPLRLRRGGTTPTHTPIQPADLAAPGDPVLNPADRQESLLEYLDRRAEQVLEWLSWHDRGVVRALPALEGVAAPDTEAVLGRLTWSLYLTEAQARQLRDLLETRARQALVASDNGTAVPRFGQDDDDVFFVQPFLRYRDEKGCERTVWGPASQPFRVAAPLEPQAQRPSLVILPDLADLRRGGARGITFVAPRSLADKILKLKMDMDVGTGGPGNPAGACFGFSFSLPVITLVALILLMIMINLLNILFWWLPYAFLALPRLCLRALARVTGGGA